MSKLKPIKDDAELARVPLEEPVLVELEPAATGEDRSARAAEADEPEGDNDTGDDDISAQLRAAQADRDREREARERAEREAREAREEAERLRATGADTEKELLTSSLEKAQQDQNTAKAEHKRAYEEGDADAMADAQSKMARAAAQIVQYEGAIANFDEGKKPAAKPDASTDILTAIDRDPKLLQSERDWLKQHPETLTDSARNAELTVAHNRAIQAGHPRGTDGYFKSVDKFMGFDKSSGRSEPRERETSVSAPVTRDAPSYSGRPLKPTQVQLTPEERALARSMGQSETVYARNKLLLQERKKTDPDRYATTR